MEADMNPVAIDPSLADHAALELAATLALRTERAREFEALARRLGWLAAAEIASFDAQSRALRLPHWSEDAPCRASVRGKGRASRLLRRMLRRGISRYAPLPLEAIA
jgi:hypothetical protein